MLEGSKKERGMHRSIRTTRMRNLRGRQHVVGPWSGRNFSEKEEFYIVHLRQDIRGYLRELRK
jgi:hypothetical protein